MKIDARLFLGASGTAGVVGKPENGDGLEGENAENGEGLEGENAENGEGVDTLGAKVENENGDGLGLETGAAVTSLGREGIL